VEHSELPDDLNLQKFVQLGAITITVRRGVRKLRRVPQAWSKVNGLSPVNQVSEKTLKGKAIENSIRLLSADWPDRH